MNNNYAGSYSFTPPCGGYVTPNTPNMPGLFPLQFGMDNSGLFAFSLYGLAVVRPDGRSVVYRDGVLVDVSAFVVPGSSAGNLFVYRIPVFEIRPGDLIVVSECPCSLLYVLEPNEEGCLGLDPFTSNIVRYVAPLNLCFNYYVRVESLCDLLVDHEGAEHEAEREEEADEFSLEALLPMLLFGQSLNSGNIFLYLLLLQGLGRRHRR